jgi:hypothetical protein
MRQLTAVQKKLIKNFIAKETHPKGSFQRSQSPFRGNKTMLTIDDIPMSIYQQIEANNNTEILYQEVDRYICDESQNIS